MEGIFHGFGAEKDPSQADPVEGGDHAQGGVDGWEDIALPNPAVDGQGNAVESSPDDKVPRRAVPESAQHHGNHQVAVGLCCAAAISAQGNIEVIPEPGGQTNMPSSPEFSDVGGEIGEREIAGQVVAQESGGGDGHVGVAGEVAVDLHGVEDHGNPDAQRVVEVGIGEYRVDDGGKIIGDTGLLDETDEEQGEEGLDMNIGESFFRFELRQEGGGTDDGSRHELREETDEEGEIGEGVDGL